MYIQTHVDTRFELTSKDRKQCVTIAFFNDTFEISFWRDYDEHFFISGVEEWQLIRTWINLIMMNKFMPDMKGVETM